MAFPTPAGALRAVYRHPLYMQNLIVSKFASLARYRWAERHDDRDDHVPPPLGYKLVLTYKCNLRCLMCYEWGEVGWCHDQPKKGMAQELDWAIIQKLFDDVGSQHPYFILIGGEPLLYSRFGDLAARLRRDRCFAITCTNGMFLDRIESSIADNPYLTFLISLDGLEEQNDLLRGAGVYRAVTRNIERLKKLARPPYIGIEFTIRPENVGVMYAFCEEMARLGVDWILLNPCWFVSTEQARHYETFMQQHFDITPTTHLGYLMPYDIDKGEFLRQLDRINGRSWPIQISCYLQKPEHIHTYVDTPEVPPGNSFCYRQWARMDVTPQGDVTPCILYPDLVVGNLREQSVLDVWNSSAFAHFRQVRRKEILPVCAKCNALYLHDAKRKRTSEQMAGSSVTPLLPLERLGAELRGPVLVISTKVGRGMYTIGEALVERLRPLHAVEHIAVEDALPSNAVDEDLRRYKWISNRCPALLNLPYRVPYFYYRKLRRETHGRGSDLGALQQRIAVARPGTVLCVSHRPAFWAATLKRRQRLSFDLWGLLGEYGNTLGWRYIDWPEMNGFLAPVDREQLTYPFPPQLRFERIDLPARLGYTRLAESAADRFAVLLVCGFWGQGPIIPILRTLLAIEPRLRITAVCGENEDARETARRVFERQPNVTIHGVVDSLLPFLAQCRCAITKPGISTILEARAAGRKIFLLKGMPVAEDNNAVHATRHFGAEWFSPTTFNRWLAQQV